MIALLVVKITKIKLLVRRKYLEKYMSNTIFVRIDHSNIINAQGRI